MTQPGDQGQVYYIYNDRLHNRCLDYVQGEIADVKAEMNRVERDLQVVQSAGEALDAVLALLARMKELAAEAAASPAAQRAALSAQFERLKSQVDDLAATALAGWSEIDAVRLRQMIEEMGRLEP